MQLLKENIDCLIKPITAIINDSFSSGVFPMRLREAMVSPILKKSTMDKNILENYRLVSNISYVSKIMEKLVCSKINEHIDLNNLMEDFQSAYRQPHSTETALLRVKTDILKALDHNKAVAVVLLYLSAAFDTVNHQTLCRRLSNTFQVTEKSIRLGQIISS